jgi:hypothetical protein
MVKVNLQNSENIIKNIIKSNTKKQFFMMLNEYMQHLYIFPNEKIRDVLYNIEQFRFDTFLQPELSPNGSPSSMSSDSGSNSTKSSAGSKTRSNSKSTKKKQKERTNSALDKRMIKATDKGSGTNNLIGTGKGTTLTGNNPFAVLKASAIAASQQAVFPNNFTNLPRVHPPFLNALEGEDKHKLYTLVLDLDETLIHNVEYGSESFFLVRPGCI